MKPIVFPEQIKWLPPIRRQELSFEHYKIDYSQCLGRGSFGTVYAFIPRPNNEKNIFSSYNPYLYDWLYPPSEKINSPYCIKISHYISKIWGNSTFYFMFKEAISDCYSEKRLQHEATQLRNQYGISNIQSYSITGWFSQPKTRIYGNTLLEHANAGTFLKQNNESYKMRKAFVEFLWAIASVPLILEDLHSENVMYDSRRQQWEIVDGNVIKLGDDYYCNADKRRDDIQDKCWIFSGIKSGTKVRMLLDLLVKKAADMTSHDEFVRRHYDEVVDRKCLQQMRNAFYLPKEFHFLSPQPTRKKPSLESKLPETFIVRDRKRKKC